MTQIAPAKPRPQPPPFDWGTYNPMTLPRVEPPPPTKEELQAELSRTQTQIGELQVRAAELTGRLTATK